MPNKARNAQHWRNICNKLAAGGEKPRGQGWRPGKGEWKTTIDNILTCPETKRRQNSNNGRQSTLSFALNSTATTSSCTCGWDHDNETTTINATAAAAAPPPPRPQKEVPFCILRKPAPRGVAQVRGIYDVIKEDGCFNLEVFGYYHGKCPHCKSSNVRTGNANSSVKLIYTRGKPRFVQGIGLTCGACNGRGWQSFEKTYVDTFPKKEQAELHAVIGKRCGVDTDR
jgi:hypothetical protein